MNSTTDFLPATRAESNYADIALRILKRLLGNFQESLALTLWDDVTHHLGHSSPTFSLVIHDPAVLKRLVLRPNPILLADAYFTGLLDLEGDLYAAMRLKGHFQKLSLSLRERSALLLDAMRLPGRIRSTLLPPSPAALNTDDSFSHHHS